MKIVTLLIALAVPNIVLAEKTSWYKVTQDTYYFQQSKKWKLFSTDLVFIQNVKNATNALATVTFWQSKKSLVRCIDGDIKGETSSECFQLDDNGEF